VALVPAHREAARAGEHHGHRAEPVIAGCHLVVPIDHGVVEQGSLLLLHGVQGVEQVREALRLERVVRGHDVGGQCVRRDGVGVVVVQVAGRGADRVVGHVVVADGHDVGEAARERDAREREERARGRRRVGGVAAIEQGVRSAGGAAGLLHLGERREVPFEVPHEVAVLLELEPVGGREARCEGVVAAGREVQDARLAKAHGRVEEAGAVPPGEQARERRERVGFVRQRLARGVEARRHAAHGVLQRRDGTPAGAGEHLVERGPVRHCRAALIAAIR
jgi:hypothetical protein